jgi:hypothetical protein
MSTPISAAPNLYLTRSNPRNRHDVHVFWFLKEERMVKSLVVLLVIALFGVTALPIQATGPAAAQACGTGKGPPPPG